MTDDANKLVINNITDPDELAAIEAGFKLIADNIKQAEQAAQENKSDG